MSLARDIANYIRGIFVNNSTGNVGIGTSSPATKLHVVGTTTIASTSQWFAMGATLTGSSYGAFYKGGTTTPAGYIGTDGGGILGSGTGDNFGIRSEADLLFMSGGSLRGQFTSSGNLQFNSGYGSVATAYGCRAWVDFNGQSTVAIRASGNVSSITDHNTGDYTVNFDTTLTDQNFALAGSAGSKDFDGVDNGVVCLATRSSSTVRIYTRNVQSGGAVTDYDAVNVAIFR